MKKNLIAALAALATPLSFADTLTVDNRPGSVAMYTNVEDAYAAASDGDVILLSPSSLKYQLLTAAGKALAWHGGGVNFTNRSVNDISINETYLEVGFAPGGNGSTYRNMKLLVRYGDTTGVDSNHFESCVIHRNGGFSNSSITGENSVFEKCAIWSNLGGEGCVIENSYITGRLYASGVFRNNIHTSGQITDLNSGGFRADQSFYRCIFLGQVRSPNATMTECITVNNISNTTNRLGNIDLSENGAFTLQEAYDRLNEIFSGGDKLLTIPILGSIARRGTDDDFTDDIGMWGGEDPFTLEGDKKVPRITALKVSRTVDNQTGLRIQVEATAGE